MTTSPVDVAATIDAARCDLVLVDLQARLMPAIDGASRVLRDAHTLAEAAHLLGIRVLGTEQNPAGLGPNVESIRDRCDVTLAKMHFDACADGLVAALDAPGGQRADTAARSPAATRQVVIAGCEAHVCLMQTALGLLRHGRQVFVVADACGARRPSDHALAMQRLAQAGAVVTSTEMVLFEWMRRSDDPRFRAFLQIVKARDTGAV